MVKRYKIADLLVEMDTFGRTEEQAEAYRFDYDGDAAFRVSSADYIKRYVEKYPDLSQDTVEYMCSGSSFYKNLLDFDGLMVHASAVVVDGRAYLFAAASGTGKSTHTNLWLERFGDRAYILNDDKPAIRKTENKWLAYGTPWSGKHDISVNAGVPLAGIAVLERGSVNKIKPLDGIKAVASILKQVNRPREEEYRKKLLAVLDRLIKEVPIWELSCTVSLEAVDVSFGAMSEIV